MTRRTTRRTTSWHRHDAGAVADDPVEVVDAGSQVHDAGEERSVGGVIGARGLGGGEKRRAGSPAPHPFPHPRITRNPSPLPPTANAPSSSVRSTTAPMARSAATVLGAG